MSIKRIFIVISAIFAASAVFADNSSVTSKKYVDDLMSGYQGKLPGSGANTLMIYDDETGIGEKSIAATLGNSASAVSVPTVGAVKTGLDGVQDTITGTAGYVMTGTGTPGEVGERAIYSADTNYSDALVTAETVNTGVINAVNNSLRRVNENGDLDSNGTLWEINTSLFALGYLPDDYTKLEYIESTGTQYIDTGYALTTDNFEISGRGLKRQDTTGIFFGARNTTSPYVGVMESRTSSSLISFWTGAAWVTYDAVVADTKYDFKLSCGLDLSCKTSCSGFPDKTFTAARSYVNGSNINLFGNNPFASVNGSVALYAFSIKDNGVLVRDFIPAKNSSGVVGMYDTVSGQFFTKQGTGDFTAGPSCISPNLLNPANIHQGTIYSTSGVASQPTSNRCYFDFIKVKAGDVVYFSAKNNTPAVFYNMYLYTQDNEASYVNAIRGTAFTFGDYSGYKYTITADGYVRGLFLQSENFTPADVVDAQVVIQSSAPTTYRPYGENICD